MPRDAVKVMEELGLTHYEAEVYVALTRLESGTASDIGRISEIPRSRVYDVAQGLAEKGLVVIHRSRPLTYRASSPELTLEKLRQSYDESLKRAEESLNRMKELSAHRGARPGEFWIVSGMENISARAEEMMRSAKRSILASFVSEHLMSEAMLGALKQRAKAKVELTLVSPHEGVLEKLRTALPGATLTRVPETSSEIGSPGRLIVIDEQELLLSTISGEELPGIPRETAIWSDAPGFASTVTQFVKLAAETIQPS